MVSRFPRIRSYELMVIFHPETEDEALAELIGRVQSYVTDVDGTVTVLNRENPWGRRRLAYPIRHESRDLRDGIYVLMYFDVEASRTVEIEREIKLNTRIIRYMLIQQSTPKMEPPVPAEETPPAGEQAPSPAPDAPSEVSPSTPAGATPTPAESMVPATADAPLAAEDNLNSRTLDSTSEPALPSESLPPADVSLVEVATASDPETPSEPAPAPVDLPMEEAPPEAADLAESASDSAASSDESEPTPTTSA